MAVVAGLGQTEGMSQEIFLELLCEVRGPGTCIVFILASLRSYRKKYVRMNLVLIRMIISKSYTEKRFYHGKDNLRMNRCQ